MTLERKMAQERHRKAVDQLSLFAQLKDQRDMIALSDKQRETFDTMLQEIEARVAHSAESLAHKMGRMYCDWKVVGVRKADSHKPGDVQIVGSYTMDKDGDGYYWWKVERAELIDSYFGVHSFKVPKITEGKYRSRKAAQDRAIQEFVEAKLKLESAAKVDSKPTRRKSGKGL